MAIQRKSDTSKLQDTNPIIGSNSRLELYWQKNGYEKFYKKFRGGLSLPKNFKTIQDTQELIKRYHLHAIGFGNWVTQEDRFNYICALTIALYDINKVLQFNQNTGLNGTVSFSFGARGAGGALAHFEPHTFIINVTRYVDDTSIEKEYRFIYTGGAGSVAHEYGHALDYYFGYFKSRNTLALSGGSSVSRKPLSGEKSKLVYAMDDLLDAIIWKKPYAELSAYYQRLQKNFTGDYIFRRNEIFARAFEKYIQYKLSRMGIKNKFLNEPKYLLSAYPSDGEMLRILPQFDNLISLMRKAL